MAWNCKVQLSFLSDDFDHAVDVMRRLSDTELSINEVLAAIRMEEEQEQEKRRPRRTCAPSLKAAERAALPSDSTDTNDFVDA